jgi:hypothetical protein
MRTTVHRLLTFTSCTLLAGAFLTAGGPSASAGNFGAPQKSANVNRFIAVSRAQSVPLGGVNRFLAGNPAQPHNGYASVNLGGVNRFLSGNQAQPYQQYPSVPLGGVNRFLSGN